MDVNVYKDRAVLDGQEQLAIALHEPSWDRTLQRGTKGTFQHVDTSVSRLSITPIAELVELFKEEVGRGIRKIEAYGLFYVHDVEAVGAESESTELVVTADPLENNPAHAEIIAFEKGKAALRKRVPDGVQRKLADLLDVHVLDDANPQTA